LEHDLGDGHKYHSLYAHLDSVTVTEGATVSAGQKLDALGQSCQGALSCASFSTPHLHWVLHRDRLVGGSGTGGSYGGNAAVPEPMDGAENLIRFRPKGAR
jgi:murein DD-endopeptidase MepM/ murein hydrolase activator NlpD